VGEGGKGREGGEGMGGVNDEGGGALGEYIWKVVRGGGERVGRGGVR